jgi:hypothetical protein
MRDEAIHIIMSLDALQSNVWRERYTTFYP